MNIEIEDRLRDAAKIQRTLLRLKHTLRYDREYRELDREKKVLLAQGIIPQLETDISELLDES